MSHSISSLLDRLSRDELRAFARVAEIPGRSKMTKAELIEAVRAELETAAKLDPPPPSKPDEPKLSEARKRRLAAARKYEWMVDRRRSCTLRTIEGFACGLPAVADAERCALHGGVDISNLALPASGHLGMDTWPSLIRHLLLASYDSDALGLDPVVSERFLEVF